MTLSVRTSQVSLRQANLCHVYKYKQKLHLFKNRFNATLLEEMRRCFAFPIAIILIMAKGLGRRGSEQSSSIRHSAAALDAKLLRQRH
jgi:hypothetical protein